MIRMSLSFMTKLAGGIRVVTDPVCARDLFEVTLRSGRTVAGAYEWGMGLGEFERLTIREAEVPA
jgi:hypothetical protein